MKITLSVKNKLGFVDGSIAKPSDNELVLLNYWTRNNNIVISWILNSVSKEISASILFADSAAGIWQDLKERFQQSNGPRVFQLRRELVSLRQEQDSVSLYFTKLKALWEELTNFRPMCHCGQCNYQGVKKIEAYFQTDYTMAFLMGLNDSLAQIRSQILLIDPLPPINRVFSLIVQEERQRVIGSQYAGNNSVGNLTFAVKGDQQQQRSNNNNRGYMPTHRERPFCTKCNIHGHTIDTCYKIHGYPPGYKLKGKFPTKPSPTVVNQTFGTHVNQTSGTHISSNVDTHSSQNMLQKFDKAQVEQLMAMFAQHLSTFHSPECQVNAHAIGICLSISENNNLCLSISWIFDSGASRHICSNLSIFQTHRPVYNSIVTLSNHDCIRVKYCGDIRINNVLTLKDVLYVPELKFNLLSVSSLLDDNKYVIQFCHDSFIIQEILTKKMIGKGRKIEGLYVLDAWTEVPVVTINQISVDTWHMRLGHPSIQVMDVLKGHLGYGSSKLNKCPSCYICLLAKQRRLSFVSNQNISPHSFDLKHCDVWGPHHVSTYNGHRYFLTLVDDCT
ncbi:uncharacterized protein LOC142537893 [Primulina tabacum]|uniref:uncharacterized protein LOC142537893 n=1 Tax=Primulina tabacum TaxID=48773 RepID=UPI003F59A462